MDVKGVTTRGTAKSLNKLDLTIAGKQEQLTIIWMLGF